MPLPEALRGEVWDVDFPEFGTHPAVVMSVSSLNVRLGHVAVVPVTGTPGPEVTHVPLTADAGLTRYPESSADITGLQPVARSCLVSRRGLLTLGEVGRLAELLRVHLSL